MRRLVKIAGERDVCVRVLGLSRSFLPVPIIFLPPGTSQQICRNNEPSFSTARSSLEIALRLRTAGLCVCRGQVPPQFPPGRRRPLYAPAGVDSQDDLRPPLWSSAFFFIVTPPCKIFNGILPVVILEEILPKQHGTGIGLQKKQNFVIQYN